jgi:hypothetical protein
MSSSAADIRAGTHNNSVEGDTTSNDSLNLLDLPPELQLMVLHEIYADMPKDRHGRREMTDGC